MTHPESLAELTASPALFTSWTTAPFTQQNRQLQLWGCLYEISCFDQAFLEGEMMQALVSAVENCDVRFWECLFHCGLSSGKSFPPGFQLGFAGGEDTDLMWLPLFPGGSHLLSLREGLSHEESLLIPSVTCKIYQNTQAAYTPREDRAGGVVFPVGALTNHRQTTNMMRDYLGATFRQLWSSVTKEEVLDPETLASLNQIYAQKRLKAFGQAQLERFARALNIGAPSGTNSGIPIAYDIEDLPFCAQKAAQRVQERGDHPKDPERYLLFGLLAGRVPEDQVLDLARALDLDGLGVGENAARARLKSKQTTQGCNSVIAHGLCPFSSDQERNSACYSHMNPRPFFSPVFLLGKKRPTLQVNVVEDRLWVELEGT